MTCSPNIVVFELEQSDHGLWLEMRKELWPDSDEADAETWTKRKDAVTLVAARSDLSALIGFVEVGTRPYADGCATSPVGFVEGWYVAPLHRGAGVGACLIQAAKLWAPERALRELASDSLLENHPAHLAHLAVGFEEVERSVKYRLSVEPSKTIPPSAIP